MGENFANPDLGAVAAERSTSQGDGQKTAASEGPPYSSVLRVQAGRDLLFLSGQLPVDQAGVISSEGVRDQLKVALTNAVNLVQSAGAERQDIVRVGIFVCDLSNYAALNEAYVEVMGDCRPARTVVEASRLPRGALAEVEMIAAVRPDGRSEP